ncbi:unnamed protein product [Symbiodinium sp. CCMP2592]|nr:unnamed protein product [Symbiodinium sp. CCMP2592]
MDLDAWKLLSSTSIRKDDADFFSGTGEVAWDKAEEEAETCVEEESETFFEEESDVSDEAEQAERPSKRARSAPRVSGAGPCRSLALGVAEEDAEIFSEEEPDLSTEARRTRAPSERGGKARKKIAAHDLPVRRRKESLEAEVVKALKDVPTPDLRVIQSCIHTLPSELRLFPPCISYCYFWMMGNKRRCGQSCKYLHSKLPEGSIAKSMMTRSLGHFAIEDVSKQVSNWVLCDVASDLEERRVGATQGEEMLLRLLQGQQEQLQRLQEMMGAQVHGQQQLAAATQSFASASSATKGRGLIDVKAVGRPSQLGGTLEEASRNWRQWSYRLELWLASQFPDARKILAWVKEKGDTEIPLASLESTSITGVAKEAVLEFNRQLEVVLGTLTSDAPGDITMNSSTGSGLDMFRRLHARLDPSDMVTSMRWLRSLMSTSAVDSVTDLVPAIEKWEDAHRRYSQRKDCAPLTEQQKMVSLIGLAPSELQGHLELNLGRLSSYELLRREMVSFADTMRAFTATDGAVPMEVDALKGAKGPKGKGKKGDKGKDKAQAGKGNKNRPKGRANELDGTEGGAMDGAGDAEYEAEEPDEEAEAKLTPMGTREDGSGGDGALRSSPGADTSGAGSSTDPPAPKAKAKAGTTSSTPVGLRMADMSVLNKLQERRRELEAQIAEVEAKGSEGDQGELTMHRLMLDMVKGQIKRAQELKRNREERISARLQADLNAGHNPRLAKRKEKSRQRAAKHRQSLRLGQAKARVRREEALERRFNIPERARKQDEYPLLPSAGSKVAAPPSRREKAMMRGEGEDREHSGDELDEPKERDWSAKPRRLTPEGREGKRLREQRRKKRRAQEMKEEAGGGPPRSPPAGVRGTDRPSEPKGPPPKLRPTPKMVFTFIDGSGVVVRRKGISELTLSQKRKVEEAIASAPWRAEPKTRGRPQLNKYSQMLSRFVNYLKGYRPALPEKQIRRRGLAKQYQAATRFRARVGIRRKLRALAPRGTVGETIANRDLDDDSDCHSCHSRRVKTTEPADRFYKKRRAARAKQKAQELLSEDEEDAPRGYDDPDTDSDPGHRPLGRGPRSPPGGGEGAKEAVAYSLATTIQIILDSGASHNVIPQEWVKHLEWGPAEGPAGFRTADGSWLPNLGTAVVSLRSTEGFSFKVRFCVASVQRALLRATQVLKLGHTIVLKGSRAVIHVKGSKEKTLVFKILGSPKATFAFKGFPRHCPEESNSGKNRSGSLYVGEAGSADPPREEAASASSQPQVDEGQSAQPLARPDRPTPEMIAAHEVSHVPHRSWCRACVAGRGRAYQHKASGQESTVPVISMDYLYFNERTDGAGLPTIVLRDRHSKAIFSHLLPCKGTTGSTHPERAILKDLEFLGYKKLVLKNDQEASIKALSLAVRNGFSGEIVPEESPKGDHHGQSNGEAERSVQTVQGLVRTLKASLTEKGITLEPTSSVFAWMIEYAGVLHTLFSQELHEGLTPFQRIKGRKWQVALPCFGEAVDYRRNTRSKLDSRWQSGVYLGLRLQSTEKIVGTNQGIFVVQSIKRKPEGQQWDSDLVKAVRGLPWKTSPDETGDGARLPEPLTVRAQVEEGLPPPARELVKPEDHGSPKGLRKRKEREEQRESEFFDKVNKAEEKKRKVSTEQEASSSTDPPAAQPSRPLTIARQPPLRPEVPSEPSSLPPGGAAASAAPSGGQKRKSRAGLAPPDERSEGQKRKSPEDAEGMIEELILQEREGFIASIENEEQPTCDLEDDLWEEKFYDENTGKELPAEGDPSYHRKKGINEDPSWTEFFAAMPPLSSLRALFTLATTGRVPGPNKKAFQMNEHGEVCVLFIDVKKAHFWSPVRRRLLVELPPEAGEGPDKVGLLKRSLYGTRDAPSNWEHAIKKVMTDLGFKQGVSNPCLYFHPEHGLRCNVHGDDFTVVGGYNKLQWLIESLQKAWTIEVRGILARPGSSLPGVTHSISVLNRLVTWTTEGIEMEADPRHVDLVLEHLGLNNSSPVTTPLVKSTGDEDESPLSREDAGLYRSIAMRIGYLSSDRPDMLRTVRELAKGLKEPTQYHWNLLKRAGRYLRGAPRLVQLIPHQEGFSVIQGWTDTDHAGCVRTRKSTTGTVVQLGKAVIKATAKGQAVIALSSGEAEYYGLISTTSACLGEQAMLADWGINCPVVINMDATTGISIGSRRGLGRVKHIHTCFLWVQEVIDSGRVKLKKVPTGEMLADLMTKPLDAKLIQKFLQGMGYNSRAGRHPLALKT